MAKLLTKHDPLHLHATLGLLCLLHFVYRWFLILTTGNAFPSHASSGATMMLSLHVGLPLVSLLLPLPAKRNFDRPMIWPEFRLHSLLFATRHVVACWAALLFQHRHAMSEWQLLAVLTLWNQAIMYIATRITQHYGSHKQRTTNTMPYPKDMQAMEPAAVARTRSFYGKSQFLATSMTLVGDPTMAFMPLLAIQIAPFCMTLVRKNWLKGTGHHCIYAWALWLNLPGMIAILLLRQTRDAGNSNGNHATSSSWRFVMFAYLANWFTSRLRLNNQWNKHAAWLLGPLLADAVLALCHVVGTHLPQSLQSAMPCPRVSWMACKSVHAALQVLQDNSHIFFPGVGRSSCAGANGSSSSSWSTVAFATEALVACAIRTIGNVCNVIFVAGVALSAGILVSPVSIG